jgi:hypothetical protein
MIRQDAGAELLKIYCLTYPQEIDLSLPSDQIGAFTMRINFLELLLAQEPVLKTLNREQRNVLVAETVRKLEAKLNLPGIYGPISLDATAMAGGRLMNDEKSDRLKENCEQEALSAPLSSEILTPCGNAVPAIVTSGLDVLTLHEKNFIRSYIPLSYPTATVVGDADPDYNCHGYAWHMSRESIYGPWSEKVSIQTNQPKDYYVTDGSYNTGGTTAVIAYSGDHSAIPEGSSALEGMSVSRSSDDDYYISKWGAGYLMRHAPKEVPPGSGDLVGYYSIAPAHTVTIHGATSLASGQVYTFTSLVTGGCVATPQYQWAYCVGTGSYINLGTASSQSFTMGMADVTLRLAVQKGAKLAYDYHTITYDSQLSVSISGPSYLCQGQTAQFTANITGGSGTVTSVSWWSKFAVGFVNSNSLQQSITMGTRNIFLSVTVVEGDQTVSVTKIVYYTDLLPKRP